MLHKSPARIGASEASTGLSLIRIGASEASCFIRALKDRGE